jgi:hypothetical protein
VAVRNRCGDGLRKFVAVKCSINVTLKVDSHLLPCFARRRPQVQHTLENVPSRIVARQ